MPADLAPTMSATRSTWRADGRVSCSRHTRMASRAPAVPAVQEDQVEQHHRAREAMEAAHVDERHQEEHRGEDVAAHDVERVSDGRAGC